MPARCAWATGALSRAVLRLAAAVTGVAGLLAPAAVWAQPAKAERDVREEAEAAQRAMDVFLREQKVLIRQGELWLELNSFYSTDTRDEFLASGALAKQRTRVAEASLIARFGLLDNLEVDIRVPFVDTSQEIDVGVTRVRTEDSGLGDIGAGLKYQIWREGPNTPDIVLSVEGRGPTGEEPLLGSGHWNVGATIALVKTLDPVVFFGRLGYTAIFGHSHRDPADEIVFQPGIGYSLNDRVSLTTQLIGSVVLDGTADQRSNRESISLQFSVTVLVTKNLFIEPFVAFGLSQNAPDAIVGLSVPYRVR
jgi:hypothetical protein